MKREEKQNIFSLISKNFETGMFRKYFIDMVAEIPDYIFTMPSSTSGTSFLDEEIPIKENYDKSRRVVRGLFKSNSGVLINSDANGSLQIMMKVFPNAFKERYGIEGVLTPIVINVA